MVDGCYDYELSAYSFRLFPPHLVSFSFVLNISLSFYKGGRIGALASTLIYMKTFGLLVSDFPELQDMVLRTRNYHLSLIERKVSISSLQRN